MRPYRHMGLIGLAAASLGVTALATDGARPTSPPKPPRPKHPEHRRAREIARRLRQQARTDAKRAASVDRSGEAMETRSGSTEGESAVPAEERADAPSKATVSTKKGA